MRKLTLVHGRSWLSSHQRFKVCRRGPRPRGSGTGSVRRSRVRPRHRAARGPCGVTRRSRPGRGCGTPRRNGSGPARWLPNGQLGAVNTPLASSPRSRQPGSPTSVSPRRSQRHLAPRLRGQGGDAEPRAHPDTGLGGARRAASRRKAGDPGRRTRPSSWRRPSLLLAEAHRRGDREERIGDCATRGLGKKTVYA